jgi:hypothetical protein
MVQGEQCMMTPAACGAIGLQATTVTTPPAVAPAIAKVLVTQKNGAVVFNLSLLDSQGKPMTQAKVNGKPTIANVKFNVTDATGAVVYHDSFEHG